MRPWKHAFLLSIRLAENLGVKSGLLNAGNCFLKDNESQPHHSNYLEMSACRLGPGVDTSELLSGILESARNLSHAACANILNNKYDCYGIEDKQKMKYKSFFLSALYRNTFMIDHYQFRSDHCRSERRSN